jgi:hypothetical protein
MPATVTPKPTPVAAQLPEVTAYVGTTRLTAARGIKYEETHNDLGSFSFTMQNTDEQRILLAHGTTVLFKEFGVAAFVGVIEDIVQVTVAGGEEAAQITTYSGRSTLAELDRAIVYGPTPISAWSGGYLDGLRLASKPFADTRYWNYATLPSYSSWTTAVDIEATGQTPPEWPPNGYIGAPSPWPYPFTQWIAPRAISGGAHPNGDWYCTGTWDAEAPYVSWDLFFATGPLTSATIWCDGVPILTIDAKDALKPKKITLAANEGTHRIVARLSHQGAGDSGEITGFAFVAFPHLDYGQGLVEDPVTYTSAANGWKCVDFGQPRPGYNVAGIARSLIEEPQDRDAFLLSNWTFGFTGNDDTAGDPLPTIAEFSTRVGSKVIDAYRSLAENYTEFAVDFASTYGRELQLWNILGLDLEGGGTAVGGGEDSGVELVPRENVLELTHHSTTPEVTVMLTRWAGGYLELATSADDYPLEGYLSIPDTTDGIQTFWNTARQMVNLSTAGESIEDVRHAMTEATQYRVRDRVTLPNRDGTSGTWRCVSRAVDTDKDGNGFVTSGFGVPRDDTSARNDRWFRKVSGTLDGRSETAETSDAFVLEVENLTPVKLRFSTGGSGVTIVGDRGTPERPDEPLLVIAFDLEADVAGASGATTVRAEVNGSSIGTCTLATGENFYRQILTPVLVTVTDWLNVETTAAGGAQGLSATALCMAAT